MISLLSLIITVFSDQLLREVDLNNNKKYTR